MTEDIKVRPQRKTLQQTAIILNISVRTVRRYLDIGRLKWSGNQVLLESIFDELKREPDQETTEEVEKKIQKAAHKKTSGHRTGWIHNY